MLLYGYSQQGWENINCVFLKKSFHQNIQKGGGRGGSSTLLAIFQYGQMESLFWHLGFDPQKMKMVYGIRPVMPKFLLYLKQKTIEICQPCGPVTWEHCVM